MITDKWQWNYRHDNPTHRSYPVSCLVGTLFGEKRGEMTLPLSPLAVFACGGGHFPLSPHAQQNDLHQIQFSHASRECGGGRHRDAKGVGLNGIMIDL